jgi:hypothetical protein
MKEFLKRSVTFTIAASVIRCLFGMLIWVISNA